MSDDNNRNILYFEGATMRGLYEVMQKWQNENNKRFLSTSIENDRGKFCCVALTNPSEVIIVHGDLDDQASVRGGRLVVKQW